MKRGGGKTLLPKGGNASRGGGGEKKVYAVQLGKGKIGGGGGN